LPEPYDNLAKQVVGGDSGQPLFMIIDGEAVLLTSYYNTVTGPSYSHYVSDINELIAHVDSDAGINTLLKVTEYGLDPLVFFKF
jgi:hypothetical protein